MPGGEQPPPDFRRQARLLRQTRAGRLDLLDVELQRGGAFC